MRPVHGLVGVAIVVIAASGPAEGAQTREYREAVGDWQVTAFTPGRCSARRELATGTHLSVSSRRDGSSGLAILNRAWSVRVAGSYRLTLVQGGKSQTLAAEDDRSFQGLSRSTEKGAGLLAQLAAGGSIEVTGPDGSLLERVDLDGIAPALARLGFCATEIATAANFPATAPSPPPPPPSGRHGKERPARARANLAELFSSDDYPASAARAGEEGPVGFRVDIGEDGRIAACAIIATSGSPALDLATCRLLRSRARFMPALDRKGRATTDSLYGRIVWRLPEPEPEPPPPPSSPLAGFD
jgi:TonB family protein